MATAFNQKKKQRVFVVGVGMTKFEKPGSKQWDYPDMVSSWLGIAFAE